MKKSSLLLLFSLLSFAVFTQKNVVHIEYNTCVKVDAVGLLGSVEKEEHKHEEPDFEKKDNNVLFKTQIDKLGKKTTDTYTELIRHYYIGDSLIRLDKNTDKMSEDELILISPLTAQMTTYYTTEEGKSTYNEAELRSPFVDSSLVYEIDTFYQDTKNILGYECYKIEVIESHNEGADHIHLIKKYEMYVTDELPLPAPIVIGIWRLPIGACALEIKESAPENPSTFILTEAVAVNKKQKNSLLELPKKYQNATKKSYLSDW